MEKLKFWSRLQADSFVFSKNRKSATKNTLSIIACITAAIILSLLIATALGYNPFVLLSDLFTKGFIDHSKLIWGITTLGIAGLSFSFAFKAGIFNIGIPGQLLMGGLMALIITTAIDKTGVKLPPGLGPIITLLIAVFFASLVAGIISLLKIYLNVNDVVSSILLNWIIFFITRLVIYKFYNPNPTSIFSQSIDFPEQFRMIIPELGGWVPSLIIFASLVVVISIISKYTIFGHKVMSVGFNPDASLYNGYNVKTIRISTMVISGALAGVLAAVLYTAGQTPAIPISKDYDTLPSVGFNGIAIGLIAMNNPIAIVPVAFIIGLFNASAAYLQVPPSFSELIIGLVILGATTFVVILNFKPWIWIKQQFYGSRFHEEYQDYENKLDVLISKYRLLLSETKDEQTIKDLYDEFIEEKKLIKNNFSKHILILKATQIFFPNIEANNVIQSKNNKLKQQYLRFENKGNKKVAKKKQEIDNNINKIVRSIDAINSKYNRLSFKILFENRKYLNENKLMGLLTILEKFKNQKHSLFKTIIDENYTVIKTDTKLKMKIDELVERNNLKANKLHTKAALELIDKKVSSKQELNIILRSEFYYLSWVEKVLLKNMYSKYVRNFEYISDNKHLRDQMLNHIIPLVSVSELDKIQSWYKINLEKCVTNLTSRYICVEDTIQKAMVQNDKSLLQLEKWSKDNENRVTKFYMTKSKLTGDLNKNYQRLLTKANKIDLNKKEKDLLISWLTNSYKEAQNNQSRGE